MMGVIFGKLVIFGKIGGNSIKIQYFHIVNAVSTFSYVIEEERK